MQTVCEQKSCDADIENKSPPQAEAGIPTMPVHEAHLARWVFLVGLVVSGILLGGIFIFG